MTQIVDNIKTLCSDVLSQKLNTKVSPQEIVVNSTRKDQEGDLTVVLFPLVKKFSMSPPRLAEIVKGILAGHKDIKECRAIGGFLNLILTDAYWIDRLGDINSDESFGFAPDNGEKVLVEYSSPNTNKPLHLGHFRNIVLGWSMSKLFASQGYEVIKTQIVNDRGIAICKSMLAWQKWGNDETPQSSGIKGDHLVGKYYVIFDKKLKEEYATWQSSNDAQEAVKRKIKEGQSPDQFFSAYKNAYFNEYSTLGKEAKDMLTKWESGEEDTMALWRKMNGWVYAGFDETYKAIGVDFDVIYYESNTYTLGKDLINSGLENGVFYKNDDGSVWIDLEDVGLDKKIVLRSDGTSVYITQDLGTAELRYREHDVKRMIYVVGNEQDYHFKALFESLKKLGRPYSEGLYHLSYGMVDLPTGKMKSREGTVVDADELMAEIITEASNNAKDRGVIHELTDEEQEDVFRKIGMSALKYFILKIHPKKRMTFNPQESLDMQGQTGPYIQNAFVRIQSVLRKHDSDKSGSSDSYTELNEFEVSLIKLLSDFPEVLKAATEEIDPSHLAAFVYNLAKNYHRFYHEVRILNAETEAAKSSRINLSRNVGRILEKSMDILGIEMPSKM